MLEREIPGIQHQAGWNDYTLIGLLLNFIEDKGLGQELVTNLNLQLVDELQFDDGSEDETDWPTDDEMKQMGGNYLDPEWEDDPPCDLDN